jgi:hypothetical protein
MAREDIYKMARALSRDTSPSSKRLPKYPLPTYLTKITALRRKADCKSARSKVLTAKHTASLQSLCTVGGDLASPRTVAK